MRWENIRHFCFYYLFKSFFLLRITVKITAGGRSDPSNYYRRNYRQGVRQTLREFVHNVAAESSVRPFRKLLRDLPGSSRPLSGAPGVLSASPGSSWGPPPGSSWGPPGLSGSSWGPPSLSKKFPSCPALKLRTRIRTSESGETIQ